MNIAIRADGSKEKGLGHVARCFALSSVFVDEGDSVRFYCAEDMRGGIEWLRLNGASVKLLSCNGSLESEADELIASLAEWRADMVIVDSYWLSSKYIRDLAKSGAMVVAVDDNGLYEYHCDVLINCNFGAEDFTYPGSRIGLMMLGGKYAMLRKEFAKIMPSAPREKVSDILVTFGGTDLNNYTPTALRGLSSLKGINVHVACGALMVNKAEIEAAAKQCSCNVVLHSGMESMAKLMAKCDLAISAGGGTARELFAMGLVSLFVLQADNQRILGEYVSKVGLPICLGSFEDVTSKHIYEAAMTFINDYPLRRRISEFMKKQVDRFGAVNIVAGLKAYHADRFRKVAL